MLSAGTVTCQVDVIVIIMLPGFGSCKHDLWAASARREVAAPASLLQASRTLQTSSFWWCWWNCRRWPRAAGTRVAMSQQLGSFWLSELTQQFLCLSLVLFSPRRLKRARDQECGHVSVDTVGLGWGKLIYCTSMFIEPQHFFSFLHPRVQHWTKL